MYGVGFGVQDSGFRGVGFRVLGLGSREFRLQGAYGVQGSGL